MYGPCRGSRTLPVQRLATSHEPRAPSHQKPLGAPSSKLAARSFRRAWLRATRAIYTRAGRIKVTSASTSGGRRLLQRTCIVVLSILVISSFVLAQQPRYNDFVGYSFQLADVNSNGRYDQLHGGEGSFEMHFLPLVSLVVDASGHFGPADLVIPQNGIIHVHEREYVFLVGPRVSFQMGRLRPFAHALFGAARVNFSASGFSGDEMNFATALGG